MNSKNLTQQVQNIDEALQSLPIDLANTLKLLNAIAVDLPSYSSNITGFPMNGKSNTKFTCGSKANKYNLDF